VHENLEVLLLMFPTLLSQYFASIPIPRKVNRNSKGEGGSKEEFFKGKYVVTLEFPEV